MNITIPRDQYKRQVLINTQVNAARAMNRLVILHKKKSIFKDISRRSVQMVADFRKVRDLHMIEARRLKAGGV